MKRLIALALTVGVAIVATAPADAAGGCGRGFHRGRYGRCIPNGGPGRVVVAPGGALVVGRMYPGRGYWDGRRYWQRRERWHGGWRYR